MDAAVGGNGEVEMMLSKKFLKVVVERATEMVL
jgi:hypothetical protein